MTGFLDFTARSLWVNVAVFAAMAVAVWIGGTRLAHYADAIAERTGAGRAFLGLMLLGGITSLPEVASTATASAVGDAPLAVNNVLGGVAMQVAILAVADALVGRDALSSIVAAPVVMLQGVLKVLMLVVVALGIAVGEPPGWMVGPWSASLLVMYCVSIWLVKSYQPHESWIAGGDEGRLTEHVRRGKSVSEAAALAAEERVEGAMARGDTGGGAARSKPRYHHLSGRRLAMGTAGVGVLILGAGLVLTLSAEALAEQTGLGSSFMGAFLVALATSLPEVSTVFAAMRLGEYEMAFSDIFGTNLVDVTLIFLADAVYSGPPVLNEVGTFSLVASLLGLTVTTIYLAGLIERKNRVIARMGIDSLLVLLIYAGGIFLLWTLR